MLLIFKMVAKSALKEINKYHNGQLFSDFNYKCQLPDSGCRTAVAGYLQYLSISLPHSDSTPSAAHHGW